MFYFISKLLFKLYFFLFFRNHVYGKENVIQGKCIIAPNHASFLDPPLISASLPTSASFLARKSLFKNPLMRVVLGWLNTYPVGGTSEDLNSLKLVCQLLQENKSVVIFPEGTRTLDGALQPIKSGVGMLAMRNQADIIPTYIHGSFAIWPREQRFPSFSGKTACVFGKPIRWEDFKELSRKDAYEAIAQKTTTEIARLKEWYESGAQDPIPS